MLAAGAVNGREQVFEPPHGVAVNRAPATFRRPFAGSISPEIIENAVNRNRGPLDSLRHGVTRNLKCVLGSAQPSSLGASKSSGLLVAPSLIHIDVSASYN
ncbi:hypothetical protein [Methylobacterium tarhaniae]|uniref:hypothetical protein n=1 Tax=Methylobacterium tarhaniae TaxID=1187852 RepID=UPI000A3F43DD|nr:hypothetical protein [Methylobacterium tarhaniae]